MEIEAKFLIKDEVNYRKLQALERLGDYVFSIGKSQFIEDCFLDTADLEITASGYYLRLRKTCGEKGQWATIKSLEGFEGGRHKREEYVGFLPAGGALLSDCREAAVRNRVFEMVGEAELKPLVKLKQKRLFRQMEMAGRHVAELALDRVELESETQNKVYLELEVELKEEGTGEDLKLISELLSQAFQLESSSYSKFERALLFREGLEERSFLSPREKAFCTQLKSHGNRYGKWARVLLAYSEGQTAAAISQALNISETELGKILNTFEKERLSFFPFVQKESAVQKIHFQPERSSLLWVDLEPSLKSLQENKEKKKAKKAFEKAEPEKEKLRKKELLNPETPETLLKLYAADKEKALRVKALALALFDGFLPFHGLGKEDRDLLEVAALLHDIGNSVLKKDKAELGKEILLANPPAGLDIRKIRLLALVLELQTSGINEKTLKKVLEDAQLRLSPGFQNRALMLAVFLRIANFIEEYSKAAENGIERGFVSEVRLGKVRLLGTEAEIELWGQEAEAAAKGLEKRKKFWEQFFEIKLRFVPVKTTSKIESKEKREEKEEAGKGEERLERFVKTEIPISLKKSKKYAKPRINPKDSMAEVARGVFAFQFEQMLAHERGTRKGTDIEELHDMRVAIRKMRAASEIFEAYLDPEELKAPLKGLRSTLRVLGRVRDLDVFWEKTKAYQKSLPPEQEQALEPLFQALEHKREKNRKLMLSYLDSEKYAHFKKEFSEFLARPGAGKLPTNTEKHDALPHRVRDVLPFVVYFRFAEISAYAEWVEGPYVSVERLHRLRIAAKGFRYTFEFFEQVLGKEAKSTIKEFKALQNLLGELNDAVVAIDLLNAYLRTGSFQAPPSLNAKISAQNEAVLGRDGVEVYLEFREKELDTLLDCFPEVWEKIQSREFRKRIEKALENLY